MYGVPRSCLVVLEFDTSSLVSHRLLVHFFHRMKEMAAYLMLVLGGNTSPTADDVTTALSTVGVEPDSEQLGKLISELEGKDLDEVLASGETMLAKFGSGGGGGGGGGGKFSSYIFVEFRSCIASLLSAFS